MTLGYAGGRGGHPCRRLVRGRGLVRVGCSNRTGVTRPLPMLHYHCLASLGWASWVIDHARCGSAGNIGAIGQGYDDSSDDREDAASKVKAKSP